MLYQLEKLNGITTKKHLIEDLIINPKLIKLTIPEGFTTEKVLNRIEALGLASKSEMLEEMKNYEFYYKHDDNFEGYFYPEHIILQMQIHQRYTRQNF